MSSHVAAPVSTGTDQEDEEADDAACPICLEGFPAPNWREDGRRRYLCCGKSICVSCQSGLTGTYRHNAQQAEGAGRGDPPTWDRIKEKAECPFCRSAIVVSNSELARRAQAHADRGKPWAWHLLGINHRNGVGTEKNETCAFECFRKAAEMGYTDGQLYLGDCYLNGLGTASNFDEAAAWFERAAAAGCAVSQYFLGNILGGYVGPSSVPIDHKRAFGLLSASAEQGYGKAQSDLATAYASGLGVPPSLELSVFWDRKGAMQGSAVAQKNLAGSYWLLGNDGGRVPATAPSPCSGPEKRPPPATLTRFSTHWND
jgi:TPR repeat protein